jgi:hypothetical protein
MKQLVEKIVSRDFDQAGDLLSEELKTILERKMFEMKKMVAARMEQNSHEVRMKRLRMDVLEEEDDDESSGDESSMARSELTAIAKDAKTIMSKIKGNKELEAWTQSKITKSADYMNAVADYMEGEDQLDEARVGIVKARIRGGKIQRRKRVSLVPGMTLRGGKLTRMSPAERRARKMGARKGARKSKQKQSQTLRKRKLSLMKRKRLGI